MGPDRAKHAVLPISKFGLMQITRQRMKPEVNIITQEACPSCNGTGKISSTLLLEAASISTISVSEPFKAPLRMPLILADLKNFSYL